MCAQQQPFSLPLVRRQVTLFAATHDALVAPKDLEFLQEVLPAATSQTLYFKGFSHLTWLVGKSDVEPWLGTFLDSVKNHTAAAAGAAAAAASRSHHHHHH